MKTALAPQPNTYQRFLEEFDLSTRVHQALGIEQNALSAELVAQLRVGNSREFDTKTIESLKLHLPPNGICLAVGDGCSIPFNPPNYGAPWLSAFLTEKLPTARIISSDLVDDNPRFIFITKGQELLKFGGSFFDFENSRFYHQTPNRIEEHFLEDDDNYLRLLQIISESDRWLNRSTGLFTITAEKQAALKLVLKSAGFNYTNESLQDIQIKIISGKDKNWEKAVYGIESCHSVDIFNLGEFKEIDQVSYLLARHLTPEVVEEVLENLPDLSRHLPPNCFIDISTVGLRSGHQGNCIFGVKGFPNKLNSFHRSDILST